jgi:ADP-heptose:LPS heptosyltransferase
MKLSADINKIIIFRALQLGDMLCIIPAVRALRNAYPDAKITLAGLPWAKSFTSRFDRYFDAFVWFPGFPGLPEQPLDAAAFVKFLDCVQLQQFDLALQMQGNGYLVNPMVELFNARHTAGFSKPGDYRPNNDLFLTYPDFGHEIERHLRLMDFLGIRADGTDLEFPLTKQDYLDFDQLNLPVSCGRYVCIHPGSRGSWRQWPTKHFAAIADHCIELGFNVVLTGTAGERQIVREVMDNMHYEAIDTSGKTSVGAIGVLIKDAAVLISNCTGVSHIASALKTPSIVISMDGEPERWGPLNTKLHYTINWLEQPGYAYVSAQLDELLLQVSAD